MKKGVKLSVVITTHNSGKLLPRTLESVSWADEIVVVDGESTDDTVEIAKRYAARVYRQPNYPMLNTNKNYGFSKAIGEWILCLDSDEVIPQDLAREIRRAIDEPFGDVTRRVVGYWIPRKNIIFGKWIEHGLWWPDKQLRLFQKGRGRFPQKHVHEYIQADGPTGELSNAYVHYNYESVSQFLWKMENIYTENEVENLLATGTTVRWPDAVRFPVSDFVKIYFAQDGYKDGLHGLVLALLQAFYSFVVFIKLWEKQKFSDVSVPLSSVTDELASTARIVQYWLLSSRIKETKKPLMRFWLRSCRRLIRHTSRT